jgi:hypothetical protein
LKPLHKYLLLLLLINVLLDAIGYLLLAVANLKVPFIDIPVLTILFSGIAIITLIIFLRGQEKDPESQTMHSLASIGVKFLLDMVLVLVWFVVAKKTYLPSVIIFFVLYLTLTLFSVMIILKTLKNKSL